jgi:hypothetical protein
MAAHRPMSGMLDVHRRSGTAAAAVSIDTSEETGLSERCGIAIVSTAVSPSKTRGASIKRISFDL